MPENVENTPGGEAASVSYTMVEHAFGLWRDATTYLTRIASDERRAAYEEAIGIGLDYLQRYRSMPALFVAYYAPLHDQMADYWVESASHIRYPEYILNCGIVEDVAYARRAQQLIAEAADERS